MKIVVDHIGEKPTILSAEEGIDSFPVLLEMQQNNECCFTSPVYYNITVVKEYGQIRVSGVVKVSLALTCSRCLEAFSTSIASEFIVYFSEADQDSPASDEEETELNDVDLVTASYCGDEIDLNYEIGAQVAMEIPSRPLCDEGCKGLCSSCGIDLNKNSCNCSDSYTSFKFSALKDFKVS